MNPNLNSPTSCYANNSLVSLTSTTETLIASNAASSGKLFLFDSVEAANVSAAGCDITITVYNAATNTGTAFRIAYTITINAKAALLAVSKNYGLTLKEGQSLYCTASVANALTVTAFWKEFA